MAADGGSGSAAALSETHRKARQLLWTASQELEELERSHPTDACGARSSPSDISDRVSLLQLLCAEMNGLLLSLPQQDRLWIRKVEQVSGQVDSLRDGLDRCVERMRGTGVFAESTPASSSHVLRIFDEEVRAGRSADRSSVMLEEALDTARGVLLSYDGQRERLKSAQRKALDVLNTVGLSGSLIKLVERRHRVDKWIKFAGITSTLLIMLALGWWIHS